MIRGGNVTRTAGEIRASLHPAPPAVGAWCELTQGFWEGGRYATAAELAPGDRYRWRTLSGYVVARVDYIPDVVWREEGWRVHHATDGTGDPWRDSPSAYYGTRTTGRGMVYAAAYRWQRIRGAR